MEKTAPHLQLSDDDIGTLREWYNRRPSSVNERQERQVRLMLELLRAFSSRPDVDRVVAERIVESWERWAVVASSRGLRRRLVAEELIAMPRRERILARGKARLRPIFRRT